MTEREWLDSFIVSPELTLEEFLCVRACVENILAIMQRQEREGRLSALSSKGVTVRKLESASRHLAVCFHQANKIHQNLRGSFDVE